MPSSDRLRIGVIMAGGSGERFWPLSRRNKPKQLLPLARSDKSMLAESIDLIGRIVGIDNVLIITGKHLVDPVRKSEPAFPAAHVLAEPCKRNTAGALAYTAAWLSAQYSGYGPENITMAVVTADHRIGDVDRYRTMVETALKAAEEQDALVTCGMRPTRPDTGFGYIEFKDDTPVLAGPADIPPVYRAKSFHEKPDAARAAQFLAGGNHYWNIGMFFWRLSVFLEEMNRASPVIKEAIDAMTQALKDNNMRAVEQTFESLETISIDYALLERSDNVLVVQADFPWDDVGTWNAVVSPDRCDGRMNYTVGEPVVIDCDNCVIYNEPGCKEMAVGVIGMSDVVVVTTSDGVLVMPRDRSQQVRFVVEELHRRNARQI